MNYCPVCYKDRKLLLVPGGFECQECFATFDLNEQEVDSLPEEDENNNA